MTIILFTVLFLIILIAVFLIALHLGFRAPRNRETKTPQDFGLRFKEVSIPTVSNKQLFGWFLENNKSAGTLIILHGWGGNAELMLPVAIPFYKAGINVLLFDSRGHGKSDADTFSSLPRFAEDLGKATDWLKQEHPEQARQIAFLGHSVGAGAALFEASKRNDIDAVISISAFAHPEWMMKRYLKSLHLPTILVRLILGYVEWVIGHAFASFAPLSTVCSIHKPILIVHGKVDTTVPIEDAHAIMEHCPEPHLKLMEVDDAGHESIEKIEEHSEELISFLSDAGFLLNKL